MRVPSYRKHSSGQARVTIAGKDHLLGKYGSPESKEAYGRLIAEFGASGRRPDFGKNQAPLIDDVCLAYLRYSRSYYQGSTEHANMKPVIAKLADLYGSVPASKFGPSEFKAVRQAWLDGGRNTRQSINRQMARLLRAVKWAVSESMIPAENYHAMRCVEPLKRGRCAARESKGVKPVPASLIEATLPHLTPVLTDMVRFQQLTGCRPGEVVKIKPAMVERSGDVWQVKLDEHKTAHRGHDRTIYVGPRAQQILAPYLLRGEDEHCFSPIESEKQRLAAKHAARVTPLSCGNRPGTNRARKPRTQPKSSWTSGTYGRAIRNVCEREKLEPWSPNQIRHAAATDIRAQFGIEGAQVILGHSEVSVTQIYAEADRQKAVEIAMQIG